MIRPPRRSAWLAPVALLAVLTLALAGCGSGEESAQSAADAPDEASPTNQESAARSEAGRRPTDRPAASDDPAAPAAVPGSEASPLMDPTSPEMNQTAPDTFRARFRTSKGDFVVEVHREWSPAGADRFYSLVSNGFYDGTRFFRVLDGFIAQWGIHGEPEVAWAWAEATIPDDPVMQSNVRGMVTYAHGGPDTRSTQIFINYGDNSYLDSSGFPAFGEVIEGMEVVDGLHSGYGEGAPQGRGPEQWTIHEEGNAYLEREFPELDYVIEARIVGGS